MKRILFVFFTVIFCSCNNEPEESSLYQPIADSIYYYVPADTLLNKETLAPEVLDSLELKLIGMGLVNVRSVDSTISVELRYSTTNNFFGVDVYGAMENAYLQPDVALKLSNAQELLHAQNPSYSLMIYDAARPIAVQQIMWDTVKMPVNQKTKYLSNPKRGSLHNYGAAVDITIVDSTGVPLDMGTDFDYFGELAYPVQEYIMLQKKLLSLKQVNNRKLLRAVMSKAGFFNIQTEWWHFNSCTRAEAELKYKKIE